MILFGSAWKQVYSTDAVVTWNQSTTSNEKYLYIPMTTCSSMTPAGHNSMAGGHDSAPRTYLGVSGRQAHGTVAVTNSF